ncbi:hypothetical protein ABK040_001236 [Willaertia magna]
MDVIKIVVAGPSRSGKTCIVNYLSGFNSFLGSEYRPTIGLRISELEREISTTEKIPIELWDVGGDRNFENCWPAIIKDMAGCILVYNPSNVNHLKEIEFWYKTFKSDNCLVFAHCLSSEEYTKESMNNTKLPKTLSKIPVLTTNLDTPDRDKIFGSFDKLIAVAVKESKDAIENTVL